MIKLYEIKSILSLALPLIAAFLAQKGMQFIDTFMMGWIGPEALAAGALGTSVYFTILVFCMGTLSAVGVFIARAKGADDIGDIKSSLQHGLLLAVLLSLPCMLLVWYAPDFLLRIGENPQVVSSVTLLLHALVWGFPGFLLFLVLREFISAFALTHAVMFVALGSIPLTFIANYILIYGKFGLPQFGIAGIGFANAGVMWFMFLCLLIYCKNHTLLKNHISYKLFQWDSSKIKDILHIGVPSGVLLILESGMFLFAAIIMGYFGIDALAAHQIAMQCASIAYAIPFALSMATAMQVGHAAGAKNIDKAARSAYLGIGIGLILTTTLASVFIFAPEKLVNIFLTGNEPNYKVVSQLASTFLIIAGVFQCFDGLQAIANGSLRGLKDTLVPMLLSIACYWILGVGSAYYLSTYTHLRAAGIWYGLTFGISSIGIILTLRLVRKIQFEKRKSNLC